MTPAELTRENVVVIGTVGMSFEQELDALMTGNHITWTTGEGGKCHEILVAREQAEEAIRIIRASSLSQKVTVYASPRGIHNAGPGSGAEP
jgi:hypothetical protein